MALCGGHSDTKLSMSNGPNFSVSNEIFEYGHAASKSWVDLISIKLPIQA
jgi:hypothetical protein